MELLEMTLEDIDKCIDIYLRAFERNEEYESNKRYFAAYIEHNDKYALKIVDKGEIKGFLVAYDVIQPDGKPLMYIDNFAVAPEYRKQGLGTAALKSFIDRFGNDVMFKLMTHRDMPAFKMYKALYFTDDPRETLLYYSYKIGIAVKAVEEIKKSIANREALLEE